jgi:DNA-binding response OmpR family regulator
MKILVIEDDANLSSDIKEGLTAEGFEVEVVYDGLLAEKLILKNTYGCILLDLNIPGQSGYQVCKFIRSQGISTPVIMLTAFGELDDKLQGFEFGADDYITKPFFFKELLARVKVFIKRAENYKEEKSLINIDTLVIDIKKKEVYRAGNPIPLTAREFEILQMLAEANGNVVAKKDILARVWGHAFDANTNTIEVFINFLRNKIDKGHPVKLINTRIGFGYYLTVNP